MEQQPNNNTEPVGTPEELQPDYSPDNEEQPDTDADTSAEANAKGAELLKSQGLSYTRKGQKLEDAKSSSWLFIVFGVIGLLLILAVWLGIIPLNLALYMKVLYTIVLGVLFVIFIILGVHYKRKIGSLETETTAEEQQSEEIIQWIEAEYPVETLDELIGADTLSMEQLYFERYEKLASLIRERYVIEDEAYLDFLIEKIYQTYSPSQEGKSDDSSDT